MVLLAAAPSRPGLWAAEDDGGRLPPRALVRIGTDDLRLSDRITAIAFSPDGRLIAAADPSVRIVIFDVRTGRPVKRLTRAAAEMGRAARMAFAPDGTKLLWGEDIGEVGLWDLEGDRLLFREKVHQGDVSDVAFSPDGSLLASAAEDAIQLRRVARPGEIVRTLSPRPRPPLPRPAAPKGAQIIAGGPDVVSLAFTPDGTRLLAGTWSTAMISVWRLSDGELLRQIGPAAASGLNTVSVTPDGRRVLSAGHHRVLAAEAPIRTRDHSVTLTEVQLWDIESGERNRDFDAADGVGFGYAGLAPDGRRAAVSLFNELRLLDAATGRLERTIELPGSWGHPPAFSADGSLVAMPDDNAVALFEVTTGRRRHHDPGRPVGYPTAAAWSPSGGRIVTGHADGVVRVRDAATGRLIWHRLLGPVLSPGGAKARPVCIVFVHDGQQVAVGGRREDATRREAGVLAIYDADSGRTLRELPQERVVSDVLSLDGRVAVLAISSLRMAGTRLLGIEPATGRTRWAAPSSDQGELFGDFAALRSEPNGTWFRAASRDGAVFRFNALTGREQGRFLAEWRTPEQRKAGEPREAYMVEAVFSLDARTLASSRDGWIDVWDVEAGARRRTFRHPHRLGCYLALAPDGRTLATSDRRVDSHPGEDAIRLFDVGTGEQVLTLQPGDDRAFAMAFSPDGTRLFTGMSRGSGIVWDVRGRAKAPATGN